MAIRQTVACFILNFRSFWASDLFQVYSWFSILTSQIGSLTVECMLCRTVFFHVSLRCCVYDAGRFWQHFPQSTPVGSIDYNRINLHLNVQKKKGKTFTNNFLEVCGSFQALVNTAGACKIRSFGRERMKLVNHGAIHARIKVRQGKSISDVWDDVYVSFHPRETTEPYSRLTWRDKPWGEKTKISAFWFHGTS